MPLRSVIFRFQNANTKAKCKCKCKGKCIGKWFLCPKCGIYRLNAASKRDFLISEGKCKANGKAKAKAKAKTKAKAKAKTNAYENGFYALNAAFIS